jgi:hypothetical protein
MHLFAARYQQRDEYDPSDLSRIRDGISVEEGTLPISLDELYAKTVLAGSAMLSRASDWMDRYIWDGLVRAVGAAGQFFGILSADFDERGINAGVDESAVGTRGLGRFMSARHSGQIQTYLGVVAIGMLTLLILYAWLA